MPIAKHTYQKLNQDIGKSKFNPEIYYDARNIRIITNESFGNVTNVKGNELQLTLPVHETNPTTKSSMDTVVYPIDYLEISGYTTINDTIVLLAVKNDVFAIYTVDKDYNITLKFIDTGLNIPDNTPLDVLSNYENENLIKIYWADGINELRYLNIAENSIDLDSNFISSVPDVSLNSPEITGFTSGGTHTSGMIQYAYNLYNLNGSQTKISALSSLLPLNNEDDGDPINTNVSKSPIVQIDSIDQSYEFLRLYSIKYTSLDSTPEIKVLVDEPITEESITFIDDNNSSIQEITFAEFTFLGADTYIPKHLITKDNHLFLANYKTTPFEIEDFDTRAYSVDTNGDGKVFDKEGNETLFTSVTIPDLDESHDAINPTIKAQEDSLDYNVYMYNDNGDYGAIGPNIRCTLYTESRTTNFSDETMLSSPSFATEQNPTQLLSLKRGEVYRFGVQFQNNKGAWSFVSWVADLKVPENEPGLNNYAISTLGTASYINLQVELLNLPSDENITNWRVVRVKRRDSDKTIVTQGFLNPTIKDNKSPGYTIYPSYWTRTFRDDPRVPYYTPQGDITEADNDAVDPSQDIREYILPMRYNWETTDESYITSNNEQDGNFDPINGKRFEFTREILSSIEDYVIDKEFNAFYSPEIVKNKSNLGINSSDKIRYLGFSLNRNSRSSRELYGPDGLLLTEARLNSNMRSFSATETHPGATILAQQSFNIAESNETERNRVATYRFISSFNHVGTDDNHLYSRRRHSFIRYFGGFDLLNSDLANRVEVIGHSVNYLAPIEGSRAVTFDLQTVDYNANALFTTKFTIEASQFANDYRPQSYRMYGGSCVLLQIEDLESKLPDISGMSGDYIPIIEIVREVINQYGGNTYEARQRNTYQAYSDSYPINSNVIQGHGGDTYIQKFNFLKTFKSSDGKVTTSEIVSIPLESSVNLDLRFDLTKDRPDNKDADENTSYGFNDVYQQENNTIPAITKPSNFQDISNFPTEILPSKQKFPGELIDSFTDFLINDRKALDGKYGEITALGEFKDNVFAFQRSAIAYLAINPRVQVQASDGIPIELGTGRLIERYQYLTTNSGTLNKWSLVQSKNGLMYYDLLNKSINFLAGQEQEISTVNGLYNKIKNYTNTNQDNLIKDNPLIGEGVVAKYDNDTEDIYFTFLSPNEDFTIGYNGLVQGFTSFYDFTPNIYITVNGKLITSIDKTTLWEHDLGEYGIFYDTYYPSYITVLANDNPDFNKIFDNLHFNSEAYINEVDQAKVTFNKFQVWNEYQDTNEFLFDFTQYRPGIKRRYRKWNLIIPRNNGTRDRISNPWSFIKLEFDKRELDEPTEDYRLVLHDLLVSYTIK